MATISNAARSAMCDAFTALINAGTGNSAGQIKLQTTAGAADVATIALNNPAFAAASNGVAALSVSPAIADTNAAGGTVAQFVIQNKSSVTVLTGSVGVVGSGADMELNSLTVPAGIEVLLTSGNITVPASN